MKAGVREREGKSINLQLTVNRYQKRNSFVAQLKPFLVGIVIN